jgi:IS5 family transposase
MISLFANEERQRKLDRIGDPLTALAATVDFAAIAARISAALPKVDYSRGGRPPFAVELMIRLLVLKQLHNLSDDEVEYQALDRASFQRFLGLSASSAVPDAKTFWTFQQALTRAAAGEIVGERCRNNWRARATAHAAVS